MDIIPLENNPPFIEEIKNTMGLVKKLSYMPCYLVDLKEDAFLKVEAKSNFLLGYSPEELRGYSYSQYIEEFLTAEERKLFANIRATSQEIYKRLSPEERKNYQIVLNISRKLSDKLNSPVQHRLYPVLEAKEDGETIPRYLFGMISLATPMRGRLATLSYQRGEEIVWMEYTPKTNWWIESGSLQLKEIEKLILCLLYQGMSYKEIAQYLNLSEHTIRSYKKELYSKLGVTSGAEAVSFAITYRLI